MNVAIVLYSWKQSLENNIMHACTVLFNEYP